MAVTPSLGVANMKFVNKRELRQITTLSIQHITRLEKAEPPRFPKRVWISENRVAWLLEEVEDWMQQRLATRDSPK